MDALDNETFERLAAKALWLEQHRWEASKNAVRNGVAEALANIFRK